MLIFVLERVRAWFAVCFGWVNFSKFDPLAKNVAHVWAIVRAVVIQFLFRIAPLTEIAGFTPLLTQLLALHLYTFLD